MLNYKCCRAGLDAYDDNLEDGLRGFVRLEDSGQGQWPGAKGHEHLHLADGVHGALRRRTHGGDGM